MNKRTCRLTMTRITGDPTVFDPVRSPGDQG